MVQNTYTKFPTLIPNVQKFTENILKLTDRNYLVIAEYTDEYQARYVHTYVGIICMDMVKFYRPDHSLFTDILNHLAM